MIRQLHILSEYIFSWRGPSNMLLARLYGRSTSMRLSIQAGLLCLAFAAFCGTVSAQTTTFTAQLSGSAVVPPSGSAGTGTAKVILDPAAKSASWTITYSGLDSPVMAAHLHGPAAAGENAPVAVPINGPLDSPINGKAVLTDAQMRDLQAGKYYVNLHTKTHPGGAIRGQLTP